MQCVATSSPALYKVYFVSQWYTGSGNQQTRQVCILYTRKKANEQTQNRLTDM